MFTYLLTPILPSSPSIISLTVSVDVKHHVYLLTYLHTPFSPSIISLMVFYGR